jgi:hypothetical protein
MFPTFGWLLLSGLVSRHDRAIMTLMSRWPAVGE